MGNFFAELKRRQMFRVAAAYAVVAWLILQVVNTVAPGLNLPTWAVTLVIVLLAVGFPMALIFAWIHELWAPSSADSTAAQAQAKVNKLDWILAGGLAAVIALILYQQLALSTGAGTERQATSAPGAAPGSISIAVLPFANLSGDASQEFFSDGMTEEITAALAKVQGLTVLARTSAFEFKGQNRNIRAIGEALNARYLIEGSVRREGDRVRITAQLVEAGNGSNVWSESYDRQLTSVFATQEDIAQAIAGALRVPLGLRQGETLVSYRTTDLELYQQYLRARGRYRAFAFEETVAILEPVVARDPGFAPAWSLLARAYSGARGNESALRRGPLDEQQRRARQSALEREEKAAREAIRLDPRHPGGYAALALNELQRSTDWAASEDLFRQSLVLDPNDADTLFGYVLNVGGRGQLRQALSVAEQLRTLEPFVPAYNLVAAYFLQLNGQNAAALPLVESISPAGVVGYYRNIILSNGYALAGRYSEAADALLSMPPESLVSRRSIEEAAALLRSAPTKVANPDTLPALEGELRFAYAFVGVPERAFAYAERAVEGGALTDTALRSMWHPQYAPLRKTERFKALMRNAGLVDYWRARGWPDLCRPVGTDDFVCD